MSAPTFYWWVDIAYGLVALAIGGLAYGLGPRHRANQLLFWVLLVEGITMVAYGITEGSFFGHVSVPLAVRWASAVVATYGFQALLPVYLVFIAHVAPVPWNRIMRSRGAPIVALLASLSLIVISKIAIDEQLAQSADPLWWIWFSRATQLVVYGSTLAMAIGYLQIHASELRVRSQARWVLAAVLARDIPWFLEIIRVIATRAGAFPDAELETWIEIIWIPFLVAFAVLATLGILKGQLIDIDRRLHFSISKTTIAAIFIAVFVGVQTLVSEYVTDTAGLLGGAAAAAFLVFALSPLQRLADRIATKAVPSGGAMGAAAAETFYREQVEIAYSDGVIGSKERQALRSVRDRLNLTAEQALGIEDAVVA